MTLHLTSHDLSYRAEPTCLLNRINNRFNKRQVNMLIGNNGAGKTTLLRLLAGFLQPDSGSISIDGDNLSKLSLIELACRRAVLPQHDSLNTVFTVDEVVGFAELPFTDQSANQYTMTHFQELKREIIEELEIKDLQSRLYHTLSGGEKQRVRLARVILQAKLGEQGTSWLLLDEPLTSLDWGHCHKLLNYLHRLTTEGLGILAVMHDLNLVLQYADEVCMLHEGQVYACGRSADVLNKKNLKNVFGVASNFGKSSVEEG